MSGPASASPNHHYRSGFDRHAANDIPSFVPGLASAYLECPHMTPKWKFDTIDAAIQALQRDKVSITAGRIHKRTGPSVTLDEIRQHVANRIDLPVRPRLIGPHAPSHKFAE